MKKLIPAICMLLVAASLLGTSTYAWFSMNTTVTATGMQVQATASKNLMISKTAGTGFTSTVDMTISQTNLVPVSTIGGDVAVPSFYMISAVGTGMTQDNAAMGDDTTVTVATVGTHVVKTTVHLKCVGDNTSNLKATITAAAGGTKALDPAIRVMLVNKTGNKTYIYSPLSPSGVGEYLTTGKAVSGKDESNKATYGNITSAANSNTVLLGELLKDTEYEFDIYIWYEGEDVNCKATNTVDMAASTFSIQFTVE